MKIGHRIIVLYLISILVLVGSFEIKVKQVSNKSEITSTSISSDINEAKIVGGEAVFPHELPYQLALYRKDQFNCGAVLLNSGHALTAAHCITLPISLKDYEVVAGKHELYDSKDGMEQKSSVREIVIHPNYDSITLEYDVAILKLAQNFTMDNAVQGILIPVSDYVAKGNALVSGWGLTTANGSPSTVLMKVSLPIQDNQFCQDELPDFNPEIMLCVGLRNKGICSGDSGGPLVIKKDNKTVLIGIASGAVSCELGSLFPAVFANVAFFDEWLNLNVADLNIDNSSTILSSLLTLNYFSMTLLITIYFGHTITM